MSRFFLDRPVFAWVVAIAIMSAGALAIRFLPVSRYPDLAPPTIMVMAYYPGASAETVENSVTQVIENQMAGLEGMIYLSSTSDLSGTCRIELTFKPGTDPDLAWSKVQNKLQLAMASLPRVVREHGVEVMKATRNYMMAIATISEDGSMDRVDLMDYAKSNLEKILSRVPGVGEVQVFGAEYAMRVWLDPDKLTNYHLTVEDVIMALRAYNVEVSAGQFGGAPAVKGQRLNTSIIVQHYLKTPEEFRSIPLRTNPDGSIVRVKDVGRVELGGERYDIEGWYNGKPAAMLVVRKEPGANSLKTAQRVKDKLAEMSPYFPPGLRVVYPYETAPFTKAAINEVYKALVEAVILVFFVMLLFLGSFRATVITTIAMPVVVLGTFASLGLFGFSINMLTMFAMVLAIGFLVDDAIVVVENVERIMAEEGLSPREATEKSMDQITSALIGIGLVLTALFGPIAFFPGSTGIIYRQFSLTICATTVLSVVVALILTPVLCASILKPVPKGHEAAESAPWPLRPFLLWFDRFFFRLRDMVVRVVGHSVSRLLRYILLYILIVGGLAFIFLRMPTSYLPDEDQGVLMVQATLPSGSTLEQTQGILNQVGDYFLTNEKKAVESFGCAAGVSLAGMGQNVGIGFVKLKDWKFRKSREQRVWAIQERAMRAFSRIKSAMVFAFPPPAIAELGNATGFDFELLDFSGQGHQTLMAARNQLLGMAMQDPRLMRVRPNGMDDVPQYEIDIDWEKAGAMGVPITSIHNVISASFGSAYVNDFVKSGRVKRVYVQLDAPYRMLPHDLKKLYVRNTKGEMVPFSSFASGRWTYGGAKLERYNGFPSINIWGEPAPGRTSGEAMAAMEELTSRLPKGFAFDWTGLSYQQKMATSQAPLLYAFAVFLTFLYLAALYESWSVPLSILLILPLGAVGALLASYLRGLPNDVYMQIGMLNTLGLTTKNAILIVQFAKDALKRGMSLKDAALEGARLRFRPIVMTSLTTGLAVLPLAVSTGPGSGAMNAIGTSLIGGMVTGVLLVVLFAPLFYVLIQKTLGKRNQPQAVRAAETEPSGGQS
ncbi:MAG: efflux RND transporter permease subunit [Deltaproteobacteria bacterium]|nr:efflux RND transporter permease subunit [Deltaproteobacteria bacterium]